MRFIILIISFLAAQQILAQNELNNSPKPEEIFTVVETMPYINFDNCVTQQSRVDKEKCTQVELSKLVRAELQYPELAKEIGLEGKVIISFLVGSDGETSDFKLVKDIGVGCGKEALRATQVICQQYNWMPATQRGAFVSVRYYLPVAFKLN